MLSIQHMNNKKASPFKQTVLAYLAEIIYFNAAKAAS